MRNLAFALIVGMAAGCGCGETVADKHRMEFEHGFWCRVNGVPAEANPYVGDNLSNAEAKLWLDGWIAGGKESAE